MSTDQNRQIAETILPLVGGPSNVTSVTHCMTRMRLGLADRSLVQEAALRALPDVMGVVEDDTYQIVLGPGKVARVTPEFEALVAREGGTGRDDSVARTTAQGSAAGTDHATPTGEGDNGATVSPAAKPAATAGGGTGARTADALAAEGAALRADRKRKNATPVKLMLRRIANIFVPLIPALIGCGIVSGINGLLTNLAHTGDASWATGIVPALTAISSGFLSLIAVFVGINTAREFGGTPVLGGAAASVIVFAGVTDVSAFGQKLAPGEGGVLGALLAALLAVHVERACRGGASGRRRLKVPEALDVLVTPTLTVLVSGLVTLFGLMYVCGQVSTGIGHLADWLLQHGGAAAGFVLGGLFLPLVMLGLHQALIPIHTTLIEQNGFTVLLPILAMAGAGQVGAALAVYVRLRRNTSIRKTIRSALPAGFLGVGEPLIYGVSLPLGRPFVTACVGGAVGGGVVGLFYQLGTSVGSTAIGPSGWALFPLLKGNHGLGAIAAVYAVGLAAGYVVGFVATYFFGFSRQMLADLNVDAASDRVAGNQEAPPAPSPEAAGAEGTAVPNGAATSQPGGTSGQAAASRHSGSNSKQDPSDGAPERESTPA